MKSDDARLEMLLDIAHEFQTPIAILKGNLEVIAKCAAGKEPPETLEAAERATCRGFVEEDKRQWGRFVLHYCTISASWCAGRGAVMSLRGFLLS